MSWDRVQQLLGTENLALLQQKQVGIVGLGSGGGYVALALAMCGVSRFVLIDPDKLSVQNIIRHVADKRYIDQPKVAAIKDLILHRNPSAQVLAYQGRVEEHLKALLNIDLLIVGVDNEPTKYVINEFCLAQYLTAIYGGVYERGEGGDVVIISPNQGPCYACWAESLREEISFSDVSDHQSLDYGQVGPEGTLKAEPALWLDVVRVANTQANMALNILLQGTSAYRELPSNTVIIANQWLEIAEGHHIPPFGVEWVNIPRNPDCLVCGTRSQLKSLENALSLDELLKSEHTVRPSAQEEEQEDD